MSNKFISYFLLIFGLLATISSCSEKIEFIDSSEILDKEGSYNKAVNLLKEKKYIDSAEIFASLSLFYQGDEIAIKSELMRAYALFLAADYEELQDVLDHFIILYPKNRYIDYALYLQGVASYVRIRNDLLDTSEAHYAKKKFVTIREKFKESEFLDEAILKIKYIDEIFANKEILIGVFYLKNLNPIAAINRFQKVFDNYKETTSFEESIYRLIESFLLLGIDEEAKKYFLFLKKHFPQSYWLGILKHTPLLHK